MASDPDLLFDFYDAELRRHHELLRAAAAVGPTDVVLDVGCGAGLTTRDAARTATAGRALGVDVSAPMLVRARERADQEGLTNVDFVLADAGTHPFPPASVDLVVSRFGTMFFADPAAAFANLGRTLRPGGRLAMVVWQHRERNEWAIAIDGALHPGAPPPPAGPQPYAFSLAEPDVLQGLLTAAGFDRVDLTDAHEPVFYGPDVDAAFAVIAYLWGLDVLAADLDPAVADEVGARLRTTLEAHLTPDGVVFDSRAWVVTAERQD